jgi:hypothetical protein
MRFTMGHTPRAESAQPIAMQASPVAMSLLARSALGRGLAMIG